MLRPDQISNIVFNGRSDDKISDAYQIYNQTTTTFQKSILDFLDVIGLILIRHKNIPASPTNTSTGALEGLSPTTLNAVMTIVYRLYLLSSEKHH